MPMQLCATGMVSGLATGSEANGALMRLEYDCFQQLPFQAPESGERLIGGFIERLDAQGVTRLIQLAEIAIVDALASAKSITQSIDIVFCLPKRAHRDLELQLENQFDIQIADVIDSINQNAGCRLLNEWYYFSQGRTGFVDALTYAQERFQQQLSEYVMIVGLDSLINNENISRLLGISDSDYPGRLLLEDNADGMIVGEAAGSVLLKWNEANEPGLYIIGVGIGIESATLLNYNEANRANGLVQAVERATNQAGIHVGDTDFRIAAITGESYFFDEDSAMIYRCIDTPKANYDIWHTADKIGEVGAATGAAMCVMAYWAFNKGYAPGAMTLCHISGDEERRGAFILHYKA